jgi:hypothetical protein
MSNLETLAKAYFTVEEEIKALSKRLADLKLKKLSYTEQISDHIESTHKDQITVGEKTIKLVKNKRKVFKRKNIEDSIMENVKDDNVKKTILKDAIEEQESNYLKVLK